jgi:5-methylcytosine-specific restriction endonuclease McrA
MNVRDKLPVRRLNPTKSDKGKKWSKHKKDLKADFNKHCAYCGSYDGYAKTYFEVDHFIPKDFFLKLGNIGLAQYSNLVYSCKFCNNNKLAKWPSQREDVYHIKNKGFIDPCNSDYDNHLYRTNDGAIKWKSDLGKWMAIEAFKFDKRVDEIKLLWNLNKTRISIESLVDLLNEETPRTDEYNIIIAKLNSLYPSYYAFHKELIEYFTNI